MKRSTRSFAGSQICRVIAMNEQKSKNKNSELDKNKQAAESFGYKYAACLCCWNHDTKVCNNC